MLTGLLHGFIKVRVDEVFVIYFDSTRLYWKVLLRNSSFNNSFQYALKYAQNFKGTVLSLFWLKSPIPLEEFKLG